MTILLFKDHPQPLNMPFHKGLAVTIMYPPKWTWSPLYGVIHQGGSCPDCNVWVEHILEHTIDGVPSLTVAQLYPQQCMKCKYDRGWDNSKRAQGKGYGLNIQRMCSALCMLAGCIAKTTTAIKRVSESAGEHTHIMNRNGFSERLWEGMIQELIGIDNTLLMSLSNSKIVIYHNDVVVTTPHGQITINHTNLES